MAMQSETSSADSTMMMKADVVTLIEQALDGAHRAEGNAARDRYRNPVQTLTFFGLTPDMTVVEVWPGGKSAWYTEVLAPVLKGEGRLIIAGIPEDTENKYMARVAKGFSEKLSMHPDIYEGVEVIGYEDPATDSMAEPGVADMVLLSRHYHNFIGRGTEAQIMADAFDALRPGGILAVVQHRAAEDAEPESEARNGYVKVSKVKADAMAAGFEFAGESEVNANAADTRDHEEGVWTLPPVLRVCGEMEDEAERSACTEKYMAIGESDRMTLKFIKPAGVGMMEGMMDEGAEMMNDGAGMMEGMMDEGAEMMDDGAEMMEDGAEMMEDMMDEGAEMMEDGAETMEDMMDEGAEMMEDGAETMEGMMDGGAEMMEDGAEMM